MKYDHSKLLIKILENFYDKHNVPSWQRCDAESFYFSGNDEAILGFKDTVRCGKKLWGGSICLRKDTENLRSFLIKKLLKKLTTLLLIILWQQVTGILQNSVVPIGQLQ